MCNMPFRTLLVKDTNFACYEPVMGIDSFIAGPGLNLQTGADPV